MKILALTDSISPWHSYWIRFGQFKNEINHTIETETSIKSLSKLQRNDILIIYRYSRHWGDMNNTIEELRRKGVKIISDINLNKEFPRNINPGDMSELNYNNIIENPINNSGPRNHS